MTSKPWSRRQPARRQPRVPDSAPEPKTGSRPRFAHENQGRDLLSDRTHESREVDFGRTRRRSQGGSRVGTMAGRTTVREDQRKHQIRWKRTNVGLIGAISFVVLIIGFVAVRFRSEPAARVTITQSTIVDAPTSSTSISADRSRQPIWDDLARSVVFIYAAAPCDWRGSGTLVLDGSYVLTNEHVSADGRCDLTVGLTEDLSSVPSGELTAIVVARDAEIDLAVLRLIDASGSPIIPSGHRPVSIDFNQPPLGAKLTTLGYPSLGAFDTGMTITFTSGDFSGIDNTFGEFYKTTAQMKGGVSGGAAFNENGLFIGIPTAGFRDQVTGEDVGINLIRPAKYAKLLFEAAQSSSQSLSSNDDANWIAGGTDDEQLGTDPRFSTCKEAKQNGFGPYYVGFDPEYDWYRDADSDGIVCE